MNRTLWVFFAALMLYAGAIKTAQAGPTRGERYCSRYKIDGDLKPKKHGEQIQSDVLGVGSSDSIEQQVLPEDMLRKGMLVYNSCIDWKAGTLTKDEFRDIRLVALGLGNNSRGAAGPSEALPEVSIGYGRSHALVIGINKYSSGFSPLKTAVKDAEAIERVLREDFGFSTTLLRDAERAEIYEAVESLSRQLGPKDAVLIYYAGHGELIEETHTAYWIPVDASRGSKGNWLASEDLTRLIREMGAKDVLVISDSCYSGGLAERGTAEELTSLDNEIRIQFLKRQYEGKSRRLIASGSLEPVLDGGGDGHSVFARALLDGLGEMSHESFTASELFNEYLQQAVAGSATQIPENHYLRNSGHKRGDFLFHRRTAATESMSGD